jgi:long-chain fatty acid transport protein
MRNKRAVAARLGLSVAAAVTADASAHAGAFALREQSAYWQGISFAGAAAGGSLSSMFWNPATLGDVFGFEMQLTMNGVFPDSQVDVLAPASDEGNIAEKAFFPAGYIGYRLSDRLVAGVGLNGPFGLVTRYDSDSILRLSGVAGTSKIVSHNANPAIAYQLTDWLSIGIGAQIQFIDLHYTAQALASPPPPIANLDGDDFGFGLTAGVQITPLPGTEIGLGYRSRIDHEIDGELTVMPAGTEFDATAGDFDLPDMVTLGIRQAINEAFRVAAGVEWTNWSRFDTVELSSPLGSLPLEFNYDDGWFFSLGGEYDVTDRLTLRAGVGYELSPIDDGSRAFRLPDSNRLWLSAGASFAATERLALDLGYTFISAEEEDILSAAAGGPAANGPFSGEIDSEVHILSIGLRKRFGGPPLP